MRAVLSSVLALSLGLPVGAWGQAAAPAAVPRRPGAPVPASFPSTAPASIVELKSHVEIERSEGRGRERVEAAPVELRGGDRVLTSRKGGATIEFRDGSRVVLGPRSIFTMEEAGPDRISLSLAAGRLKAMVAKLRSRRFEVRTAVAVASVRGTVFDVVVRSARETRVSVETGLVGVRDMRGNEVLLNPGERVGVRPEGLERAERGDREGRKGEKEEKKEEEKKEARREVERELGFQTARDRVEAAAAFEMRSAQYASERNLTDAFGKRVRLTEYVTRPDDRTFKVVSLSRRGGQLDFGFMEVSANRALPRNLNDLKTDLFFHDSSIAPDIWAEKFRFVLSNGIDDVVQMGVDGTPKPFTYFSRPVLDPATGRFAQGFKIAHRTVFGNQYEFINGNAGLLEDIWSGIARPLDAAGMTYRMQPVQYKLLDPGNANNPVLVGGQEVTFWRDEFLTRNPSASNETGKLFLESFRPGTPFKAHFIERREYLNFVDANDNKILDFGEELVFGGQFGVQGPVYFDGNARLDGANTVALAGQGSQQTTGDSAFFPDRNLNGADDILEPTYTFNYGNPRQQEFGSLLSFAGGNAREWMQGENFALEILNDKGDTRIFDFSSLGGTQGSADQQNQVADIFRKLAFERVLTSSRFNGRKIDVLLSGETALRAGIMPAGGGGPGGT